MKNAGMVIILSVFFFLITYSAYSQVAPVASASKQIETKRVDVDNDGKPDMTYYGDGKHVMKIIADTNYDGKPDVMVYNKDGKFESAQVDTDYNGTLETKFSDTVAFNKWLNAKHPNLKDKLNKTEWQFDLTEF